MSDIEEKGFYISPEEFATWLEKEGVATRDRYEKCIFERFTDKAEFKEYITKPKRPNFHRISYRQMPDHCAICKHYGDMNSFELYNCVLFPEWPIKRPRWGHCDAFKLDDEKVTARTKCPTR